MPRMTVIVSNYSISILVSRVTRFHVMAIDLVVRTSRLVNLRIWKVKVDTPNIFNPSVVIDESFTGTKQRSGFYFKSKLLLLPALLLLELDELQCTREGTASASTSTSTTWAMVTS
ncbi:hypothetical protein VNO77_16930 [Canavalia gladiata]|uniref:Uncharacterized protein n=1 Tax=Canavalia gladiata TaxID=3824 RepID=A0AAN9LI20_CANGL